MSSCFWERHDAINQIAERFTSDLAFINWSKKTIYIWRPEAFTEFELKFINDVAERWLTAKQHPVKWTHKQKSFIQRLLDKRERYFLSIGE